MKRPGILFAAGILAVAAGALALRLPRLDRRPMHCDEANQAVKAGLLLETGVYRYDPLEHHGPSLYWLTLPSLWLNGARELAETNETMYRLVPVVFGAGLIVLLLLVGDGLGRGAAIVAGLLTAISPAMVFYSRYYIQEMLLVFFTFAMIGFAWRYARTRSLGWAVAAGVSLGMMHATKETWILSGAAMGAALVLTLVWARFRDGRQPPVRAYLCPSALMAVVVGLATACLVAVLFYSSLGTNWSGPGDSILAYATYWRRGNANGAHTDHPWYYYFQLLFAYRPARGFFWSEGLVAALAAVGAILSLSRRERAGVRGDENAERQTIAEDTCGGGLPPTAISLPLARFLTFYTLVLTALYTAILYKTPWCMLSFFHGMILLAGIGAWSLLRAIGCPWARLLVGLLLAAGAAQLGWQSYALNFRFAADQRNPYVYAHASGDVLNLAAQMERLAQASPDGHDMVIHVVTPANYWPLPWYLRGFHRDHVGYWQDPAAWSRDARHSPPPSVIILTPDVQPAIDAGLGAAYNQQMMFGLQPGVLLSVYVREDLWQAFLRQQAARRIHRKTQTLADWRQMRKDIDLRSSVDR